MSSAAHTTPCPTPKPPRERGLVELLESPFGWWPAETAMPCERRTPEEPMTDHILPITPEQLARLPDGVLLDLPPTGGRSRLDDALRRRTLPVQLVLDDALTRAAVAALVVRPWWLVTDATTLRQHVAGPLRDTYHGVIEAAFLVLDMTTDQIATLARLARAAWGSGDVAPASRSPADASTEHALLSLQARAVRS